MYVSFEKMGGESRVWIYQADRSLRSSETELIQKVLLELCENWAVHGQAIPASFQIMDKQLIVLAADESGTAVSGCSIDNSVKVLQKLENLLKINLTDRGKVLFKDENAIQTASALKIRSKIEQQEIGPKTFVLNPLIQTKDELKSVWVPAQESWLNKYFQQ